MSRDKNNTATKLVTLILSFFIAVVLWVVVGVVDSPEVRRTVSGMSVNYTGEDTLRSEGLVISNKNTMPNVYINIAGKRWDLIRYSQDIHISADVSDITEPGDYMRSIEAVSGNGNISTEKKTMNIPIKVEKIAEKDVPVKIKQIGIPKNGLVKSKAQNQTIKISGAESEVANIAACYVEMDISKITEDSTAYKEFDYTDEAGTPVLKCSTIEVSEGADKEKIAVDNTLYEKKTVQVKARLDSKYTDSYYLDTDKTALASTTLDIGEEEGYSIDCVYVNINKTDGELGEFPLVSQEGIYIPDEVAYMRAKPAIVKKETKKIDITVEIQNLAQGLSASYNNTVSEVSVTGVADKISADNIKGYINAENLGAGVYNLPVTFESGDLSTKDVRYVSVTIA